MEKSKQRIYTIILFAVFALSLYLVEWSGIGSSAVAKYNQGYGTFDMKSYSTEGVAEVLDRMEPQGFTVYRLYFVADYFFVLTFGLLQITLLYLTYQWTRPGIRRLLYCVPILRGICDMIENTLLLWTLNHYPDINRQVIQAASAATNMKLALIRVWSVIFLVGIVAGFVRHFLFHSSLDR